jgi:hypothetical protein
MLLSLHDAVYFRFRTFKRRLGSGGRTKSLPPFLDSKTVLDEPLVVILP